VARPSGTAGRRERQSGRDYHTVRVTLKLGGLTGSDLAFNRGLNGWACLLERTSSNQPWQIVDHGNP
jgi:hypothetical protein